MRKNTPLSRPVLSLRNHAHEVHIIVPNGSTQAVLGTRNPDEQDARAALAHLGGPRQAPRQQQEASIELPLPTRMQTALTHQLPRAQQARLNGGIVHHAASRRQHDEGHIPDDIA